MTSTSEAPLGVGETAGFLASLPLFSGLPAAELEVLASVMRAQDIPAGTTLWRQGDDADGLHVIARGRVHVGTRLPGDRELDVATLGFGDILGEIPLLGGGERMATVRTLEDTRVLFLARDDFGALLSRISPSARTIRRRIIEVACGRLRARHRTFAESLGGEPPRQEASLTPDGEAGTPGDEYLRRLPFFRQLDDESLADLLRRAELKHVPAGHVVLAEGESSNGCWITLNGAVEEVIRRDGRAVRVRLAGPGVAFGYTGLIDGEPSSVTASTRERCLLLRIDPGEFDALFDHVDAFTEAIQRDLMAAHRATERPQAQLAYGR